ncbi:MULTISPECIES: hypothetical protein [Acinetobacter]|jgi:hypothetical protein|uniref:Uncharacterized protein n=2 Tax=Acinetobacter TaxID=469 RepID=A0AAJ6LEE3_ACIJO|nr:MULTISPECIES: hypothetical protein [Acinetobacter]MDV2485357.1 hypothetical protein [Acinetobacter towneri]MDV2486925.1 hypothetical protein [Acinetobacter johnsonii]WMG19403.1 hypothetical protein QBJ73_07645 [Acinetobacter johnsonii]
MGGLPYQSKFVGDRLRTLELSGDEDARFIKDTVFAKKISTYSDYLDHKDEKPKYPRNLPGNWTYSEIELFVSAQLLATMKSGKSIRLAKSWLCGKRQEELSLRTQALDC